jgi:hypothetical protein
LTEIGRDVARGMGLYQERRGFQMVFVVILLGVAVTAVYLGRRALGGHWRRYRLAYCGGCGLVAFVLIRGASFHHIDTFLYHTDWGKYWVNTVLEGGAISTVGYAAYRAMTQRYGSKYQAFERKVSIR